MEFDDVNLLLILLQTYYNSILNLLGGPVMVPCWSRDGLGGVGTVQAYPQPLPEGKGGNEAKGERRKARGDEAIYCFRLSLFVLATEVS